MQEQENILMATVDICFRIQKVRNFTMTKIGPILFSISTSVGQNQAIPYQIVQSKQSSSSINLQNYNTQIVTVDANKAKYINQICIFKIHIPISKVDSSTLQTKCCLKKMNNDECITLCEFQLKHKSLLGRHCYLPFFFNKYMCSVEMSLHTHLLSIWFSKTGYQWNNKMYHCFNELLVSYNRLKERLSQQEQQIQDKQAIKQQKIQQKVQMMQKVWDEEISDLNISQNKDFVILNHYFYKRIFKPQSYAQNQQRLIIFLQQKVPEINANLLKIWKKFINKIFQHSVQKYRQLFISQFAIQTRKTVFNQNDNHQLDMDVNGIIISKPSIKIIGSLKIPVEQKYNGKCKHIIVLVHGLGASSSALLILQSTLKFLYPNLIVLNSRANENVGANINPTQMGRNLSIQLFQFLDRNQYQDFQLSFIGHSMGGLIIRSALPFLQKLKYQMKHYISMSSPHLGYNYHNSNLTQLGLWALQKINYSQVIEALLMKDKQNPRESYLYQLSTYSSLSWFRSVTFFGCETDKYVGPLSSLVKDSESISTQFDSGNNQAILWQQMRVNINRSLQNVAVNKLIVKFSEEQQGNWKERMLGRASHIAYLSSQKFINSFLLSYQPFFNSITQ